MKYLLSLNLILVICIAALLIGGCSSYPQPELHPIAGTSVMFIPEGCKIGEMPAPENGIYISESRLIELMRQQQKEEEKRREQSLI